MMPSIFSTFFFYCGTADIETEKTHQSIFQGVTDFDKSQMRHAETEEKVALPAKEGSSCMGSASAICQAVVEYV